MILFQFYPKWIAPNVLTLGGFLLLVLQVGIMSYYDMNFFAAADNYPDYPQIPRWAWLVSALCIFAAHTLGKLHINVILVNGSYNTYEMRQ